MVTSPYGPGAGAAGTSVAALQAQLGGAGGAGSGVAYVDPSDPLVSLAIHTQSRGKPLPDGQYMPRDTVKQKLQMPVSQAQASIYGWTQDEWESLAKRLWYLGYDQVGSPTDIQGAIKVWQGAVAETASMQAGGHDLTPDDVLELYAGAYADTAAKRAAGAITATKNRTISLVDPTQAKTWITQAFQQSVGRAPTDAEIRVLTDSLHKAQRKNPTITSGPTEFDNNGDPLPGQATVVTQGLNGDAAQAFVQQAAQDNPEAAQYQAAALYFPALMQALASPVQ